MDIIQRNFLRLLRCGAFNTREPLEPMSSWKWNRLYQVAQIHGVTPWIADGINRCSDDFFLQLKTELRQRFDSNTTERIEDYPHHGLTNPLLNRSLHRIAIEAGEHDVTYELLLTIIAIAQNILTQGISLRQFIALGTYLRNSRDPLRYEQLREWIKTLRMERMAHLEGSMLIALFAFSTDEIMFTEAAADSTTSQVVDDIFAITEKKAADWYFTQGKSIFVRTSDSDAMIWHVKQSVKYMSYYPAEAFTNFFSNFAHSLSHIEE